MTAALESIFTKADIERLVNEIVPPIVETTVDRAMARVQATMATDIARGVSQALNEQNAKLGIDTTSAAGIREAQRRNLYMDNWISERSETERRHQQVDELLRDLTPEDRDWVRSARKRVEADARTFRETVIRWAVPVMLGALMAVLGIAWREDRRPASSAPLATFEAKRGEIVVDRSPAQ